LLRAGCDDVEGLVLEEDKESEMTGAIEEVGVPCRGEKVVLWTGWRLREGNKPSWQESLSAGAGNTEVLWKGKVCS